MKGQPAVRGQHGYPEWVTPPLTEEERAAMARRKVLNAEADAVRGPSGVPNYRKPAAPDRLGVSGMTEEEAKEWFRTGILP